MNELIIRKMGHIFINDACAIICILYVGVHMCVLLCVCLHVFLYMYVNVSMYVFICSKIFVYCYAGNMFSGFYEQAAG